MTTINRKNISKLTCGIRYEKSFRISDISGSLFDTVLHDKSTPFGIDFFPRYQELNTQDRMLVNEDRGYYLRISISDIIFQYTIHQGDRKLEEEINWFENDAMKFIIDKIIHENRIINIMRFGFMITHIIDGENLGGNVLNQLTSGEINNADQFTFRFGKKDTTGDGLVKRGVNDYVNRITTIKQLSESNYDITLDYQYYFLPAVSNLENWNVNNFFDKAFVNLDSKFYTMINPLVSTLVGIK